MLRPSRTNNGVPSRAFDVAELVAEGRLRQVQAGGRAGHRAGVGDAGDQLQMADFEVHGRHSSI